MARTWAVSSVDLHLDLTGTRVRAALESALRQRAPAGRLAEGVRLPSSRSLAKDLGIARNTVADAYGQLVAEGWLTARQGSGPVVASRAGSPLPPVTSLPEARSFRYDLRPGSPDLATFPRGEWLAATRKALTAAPNEALGLADPRGRIELRRMLADYLARTRGVRADPERILICSGYVQAVSLLSEVVKALGGTTIAVEEFGYSLHRDVVRGRGGGVQGPRRKGLMPASGGCGAGWLGGGPPPSGWSRGGAVAPASGKQGGG